MGYTLTDIQGMAEKLWKTEYCLISVNQTFIFEEYESSFGFFLLVMVVSSLVHFTVIIEVTRNISLSFEIWVTSLLLLCTSNSDPL